MNKHENKTFPLPLTPRETEVAELMIQGKSNKYIQEKLCISHHTVKAHIRNIYYKYRLKDYYSNESSVKRLRFALLYPDF